MIKIKLSHFQLREVAQEDPAQYEALRAFQKSLPSLDDILADRGYHKFEAFVNDIDGIPNLLLKKASFERPEVLQLLEKDGMRVSSFDLSQAMSTHQIHLPGNELLRINRTHYETDCCTEEVQRLLENGWRIIAVCPQQGQRRPDYIFGKNEAPLTTC